MAGGCHVLVFEKMIQTLTRVNSSKASIFLAVNNASCVKRGETSITRKHVAANQAPSVQKSISIAKNQLHGNNGDQESQLQQV